MRAKECCRYHPGIRLCSLVLLAGFSRHAALGAAIDDTTAKPMPPNIILMLADDLGYNDVSYHGSEIQTPTIDRLAAEGVRLESFYTQYLCSPTRAALLTGRYPIRYGWHHGNPSLEGVSPVGVPVSEVLLPQRLRDEAGYRTAMIGKWHLGYYTAEHLPVNRGFDSYLGFYEGWMDYWKHTSTAHRLDLHNDSAAHNPTCLTKLPPLAGQTIGEGMTIGEGLSPTRLSKNHRHGHHHHTARHPFPSPSSPSAGGSSQGSSTENGTYSMGLFTDEAVRLIHTHTPEADGPLFMYLSFQAPHGPLQAPDRYVRRYADTIADPDRRTYAGMVTVLDESVAAVMSALESKGEAYYNNTVVFFISDNGAELLMGGNNYPLRGGKHTLFEGGMRTVALVHSPLLQSPRRIENGLMHITDITATILSLAHLDSRAHPSTQAPLDGVDQWALLSGGGESARGEILHNIDPIFGFTPPSIGGEAGPGLGLKGSNSSAIRVGDWKLIVGYYAKCRPVDNPDYCGWKEPSSRGNGAASSSSYLRVHAKAPSPFSPLTASPISLFNVARDPYEMVDVAADHPRIVAQLLERLDLYYQQITPPLTNAPGERDAWVKAVDTRGCLTPWH